MVSTGTELATDTPVQAAKTSFSSNIYRFTTHTQILVIGIVVLALMFLASYYYSITKDRTSRLELLSTKVNHLARLIPMLYQQAEKNESFEKLQAQMEGLVIDDDIAALRIATGRKEFQVQARGYDPEDESSFFRKTIVFSNERGQPVGQLDVDLWEKSAIQDTLRHNLINSVIVLDFLVLFGLSLHLLFKEIVTQPLSAFVTATKRIADGDFDSHLRSEMTSSEQQLLAVSFNEMIDRLRESREELHAMNDALEERVAQRTRELEQEKGRSEAIIASVADGLYTVDGDFNLTSWNRAAERITGLSAEAVLGRRCHDVLAYPFCRDNCLLKRGDAQGDTALSGQGEVYVEEFEKKGASFIVGGAPLVEKGQRMGGVETLKDISYVKKLHDQIRQADKLSSIGILAAGVAHELNNPLSNVKMYAQILREEMQRDEDTVPPKTVPERIRHILSETDRAARIVKNLLEFSRQTVPEFVKTDLRALVEHSLEMYRHQLDMDGIETSLDMAADLPMVHADPGNLQQVFINLLSNAKHAMKEKGGILDVRIQNDPMGRKVKVSVTDEGTGIPQEHLEKIFDPFFTTKEVGEGTGLGLSISYGIVKDHGGDMKVVSREGKGTTFTVTLPASP